jgi:hypothetical protein
MSRRIRRTSSQSGVRQEDFLGSLLFAVMLRGPLEKAAKAAPTGYILAIHDDVWLHGSPEALAILDVTLERHTAVGLIEARNECGVYCHAPEVGAHVTHTLGLPHKIHGLVMARSSVGIPQVCPELWQPAD